MKIDPRLCSSTAVHSGIPGSIHSELTIFIFIGRAVAVDNAITSINVITGSKVIESVHLFQFFV